jgi:hypothetical protein
MVERKASNFVNECLNTKCRHRWESIIKGRSCPKCKKVFVKSFTHEEWEAKVYEVSKVQERIKEAPASSVAPLNAVHKDQVRMSIPTKKDSYAEERFKATIKPKIVLRPTKEIIEKVTNELAPVLQKLANNPSPQKALQGHPHIIVDALAGTGKTFTIVESAFRICGYDRGVKGSEEQEAIWDAFKGHSVDPNQIHLMAFNSSAAANLKDRIPPGTHSSTIHSYGKQVLCKNGIQGAQRKFGLDKYKTHTLLSQITGKHKNALWAEYKSAMMFAIKQFVGFCKVNLVRFDGTENDIKTINDLADKHGASLPEFGKGPVLWEFFYSSVISCYEASWKNTDIIDFDDMIWLPWQKSLDIRPIDLMFIDERQDLNLAQQELVYKSARRLVMVGDVNQAIYGFAGADTNACQRMSERLDRSSKGVLHFPLTYTRRCGRSIVEYARRNVPGFKYFPDCHQGKVTYDREESFFSNVKEGDMVVCRTNAPIFRCSLKLMSQGRAFRTTVRDFFKGVVELLKSFEAAGLKELEYSLSEWKEAQLSMCSSPRSEERRRNIQDQYEAIRYGMSQVGNPDELIKMIQKCFKTESDDKERTEEGDYILLTSIHQAKGLERPNVHFLQYDQIPHPKAKLLEQERNLQYVGDTRAMNVLNLVKSEARRKESEFDVD